MINKYVVLKDSYFFLKGDVVYECFYNHYGLCNDDNRRFHVRFEFVTLNPDGGYPGHTIEFYKLKKIS